MDRPLQHKLQQYSATPPEAVWQKVAGALDNLDNKESFEQRLLQYEETPPAGAWEKLQTRLEASTRAKVVPFTTRFSKPLRYAAAACFLAVLLVTIAVSIKRTEAGALEPENTAAVEATTSPSAEEPVRGGNGSGEIATTSGEEQNTTTTNTAVADRQREITTTTTTTNRSKNSKTGPVYSSLSNYVFFNDGDGRTRKVSKRMAGYVNCKEDDLACKQRLKELRQRMAASAMTTDFTGVLDLLRQLQ